MYANRYDGSRASRPASAAAAFLVNGGLLLGLAFAVPTIVKGPDTPDVLETVNVPITPPPEPVKDKPVELKKAATTTTPPLKRVDPVVPTIPRGPVLEAVRDPVIPSFDPPVGPTGAGSVVVDPPVAPPAMIGAEIDPRHAGNFQPDYPGSELRQEKEGLVKVRVLIGVDGRIKAVEQLASPTAGFFEATRRHALSKWRFKPATRDGIPVESWKVMTVRFQIT